MFNRSFGKAGSIADKQADRRAPRSRFFDPRKRSRQRMIVPGKLWCGPQIPAIDCLIGDASVGGARIRVKRGVGVPNNVFLIHLRQWTAYQARVVWRRADGNIGLAFRKSFDLESTVVPELRAMRDYCVACEDAR